MIACPQALPDEIDRSYYGAVMRINGMPTEEHAKRLLAEWAGISSWSPETAPVAELLSKVAGIPVHQFVQHHTTMPFRRAITSSHPDLQHGSLENRELLSRSGMRQARQGAFFCSDCVLADQERGGRSYWRREHQMPGLYWCPKHRISLSHVSDPAALLQSPSTFIDTAETFSNEWAAKLRESNAVRRFLAVCDALLGTKSPIPLSAVQTVLKAKFDELGYSCRPTDPKKCHKLVSDEIALVFPRDWLALEFPVMAGKKTGAVVESADCATRGGKALAVTWYALVISAIFETADEPIQEIMRTAPLPRREEAREFKLHPNRNNMLRRLYISKGGDYHAVREAAGSSGLEALRRLEEQGLPNFNCDAGRALLVAATAFFSEGLSIQESADAAGINATVLEGAIRKSMSVFKRAVVRISGGAATDIEVPALLERA